jgi:hypothetical protein
VKAEGRRQKAKSRRVKTNMLMNAPFLLSAFEGRRMMTNTMLMAPLLLSAFCFLPLEAEG